MRHLVLYSGGPDSLITYHKVVTDLAKEGDEVDTIYFDLRHRYSKQERLAIDRTLPNTVKETALWGLGTWEDDDAYIHHRNAFLILGASKYIEEKPIQSYLDGRIWLTVQKDEMSIPDRDPMFFMRMEEVLLKLNQRVKIATPWEDYDKTDMVNWYVNNGGDLEMLKDTWSCYTPVMYFENEFTPCGDCPACFRRAVAFRLNHIVERYAIHPFRSRTAEKYKVRAENGEYSADRAARILEALK